MAKDKIEADRALAFQIATQILVGANDSFIEWLGIPERVAMRTGAQMSMRSPARPWLSGAPNLRGAKDWNDRVRGTTADMARLRGEEPSLA